MTAHECALLDAARNESDARAVPLWLVGGAVRDLALGRDVHDLDLALPVDSGDFARGVVARLREVGYEGIEVDHEPRFGTTSLRLPAEAEVARLDLARLRTERYVAPGALPEVAFVDDVEADLARRDFSVNAMALGLGGGVERVLADPCGGLADLQARRLRVLHPASFADDATRLWRGARTAAVFDLEPDEATAGLIEAGRRFLDTISGERISAELQFTARRGRSGRTLALAEAWGVLRGTHPALRIDPATARALRRRTGVIPFEVFVAVLLAPLPERDAILHRLAASRVVASAVGQAAQLVEAGGAGATTPDVLAPLAGVTGATEVARTAARWLDPERQPALQRALGRWERTRPHLGAAEVIALGVPRGPRLGAALDRLRRARYLGTLNTPADARRAVRDMLADGADAS